LQKLTHLCRQLGPVQIIHTCLASDCHLIVISAP
jgi:hypothetical protein